MDAALKEISGPDLKSVSDQKPGLQDPNFGRFSTESASNHLQSLPPTAKSVSDHNTDSRDQPPAKSPSDHTTDSRDQPPAKSPSDHTTDSREQPPAKSPSDHTTDSRDHPPAKSPSDHTTDSRDQPPAKSPSDHTTDSRDQPPAKSPSDHSRDQPPTKSPSDHTTDSRDQPPAKSPSDHITDSRDQPPAKSPSDHTTDSRDQPPAKSPSDHTTDSRDQPPAKSPSDHTTDSRDQPPAKSPSDHTTDSRDQPPAKSPSDHTTDSRDQPPAKSPSDHTTDSRDQPPAKSPSDHTTDSRDQPPAKSPSDHTTDSWDQPPAKSPSDYSRDHPPAKSPSDHTTDSRDQPPTKSPSDHTTDSRDQPPAKSPSDHTTDSRDQPPAKSPSDHTTDSRDQPPAKSPSDHTTDSRDQPPAKSPSDYTTDSRDQPPAKSPSDHTTDSRDQPPAKSPSDHTTDSWDQPPAKSPSDYTTDSRDQPPAKSPSDHTTDSRDQPPAKSPSDHTTDSWDQPPAKSPSDYTTDSRDQPPAKSPSDHTTDSRDQPPAKSPSDHTTDSWDQPPAKSPSDYSRDHPPAKSPSDHTTDARDQPPTKSPSDHTTDSRDQPPAKSPSDHSRDQPPAKSPSDHTTDSRDQPPAKSPSDHTTDSRDQPPAKSPSDHTTDSWDQPPAKSPSDYSRDHPPAKSPSDHTTDARDQPPTKSPSDHTTDSQDQPPAKSPSDHTTDSRDQPPAKSPSDHTTDSRDQPPAKSPSDHTTDSRDQPPAKSPSDYTTDSRDQPPAKSPSDHTTDSRDQPSAKSPSDHTTDSRDQPPAKSPSDHTTDSWDQPPAKSPSDHSRDQPPAKSPSDHTTDSRDQPPAKSPSDHTTDSRDQPPAKSPSDHTTDSRDQPPAKSPSDHTTDSQDQPPAKSPSDHTTDSRDQPPAKSPSDHTTDSQDQPPAKSPSDHTTDSQDQPSTKSPSDHNTDSQDQPSAKSPSDRNTDSQDQHPTESASLEQNLNFKSTLSDQNSGGYSATLMPGETPSRKRHIPDSRDSSSEKLLKFDAQSRGTYAGNGQDQQLGHPPGVPNTAYPVGAYPNFNPQALQQLFMQMLQAQSQNLETHPEMLAFMNQPQFFQGNTTTPLYPPIPSTSTGQSYASVAASSSHNPSQESAVCGERKKQSEMVFGNPRRTGPASNRWPNYNQKRYDGIHDSDENAVAVTFNVIVPGNFWLWDENTTLHLRFGDRKLGYWTDVGSFELYKDFGDGNHWRRCKLNIGVDVVQYERPIAYKYVIHSPNRRSDPKSTKKVHPYEYFFDGSGKRVNRCLVIPAMYCQPKGSFFIYDGMPYPEAPPETFLEWVSSGIKRLFKLGEKKFNVPKHQAVQEESLLYYLRDYEFIFKDLLLSALNFTKVSEDIAIIYNQLQCQKKCLFDNPSSDWKINISKVFQTWILGIGKYFMDIPIDNAIQSGKVMASVLCIIYLLHSVQKHSNSNDKILIAKLLSMLRLQPDLSQSVLKCLEWDTIVEIIPTSYHEKIINALEFYMNSLLSQHNFTEWFYILPLIHLFKKKTTPFYNPVLNSESIQWNDRAIKHWDAIVIQQSKSSCRVFRDMQACWQPLVMLDHLLLPLLVSTCPIEDIPESVTFLPLNVTVAWLCNLTRHSINFEEFTLIFNVGRELKQVIITSSLGNRIQELEAAVQDILNLLSRMLRHFNDKSSDQVNCLHEIISLFLYATAKLKEISKDHNIDEKIGILKAIIYADLIVKHFSNFFGSPFGMHQSLPDFINYAKVEIEVFNGLTGVDCPSELNSLWTGTILLNILQDRLKVRQNSNKEVMTRGVLKALHLVKEPRNILVEIILECIFEAVEGKVSSDQIEQIEKTVDTRHFSQFLAHLLEKKYRATEEVSFDEILKWEIWPTLLKVYKISTSDKSFVPEKYNLMCEKVLSKLLKMIEKICDGTVTFSEISEVLDNRQCFLKLCTSVQKHELDQVLEMRSNACTSYEEHKYHLSAFCRELEAHKLQIEGFPEVLKELQKDHKHEPVCSLCSVEESTNKPIFFQFKLSLPLQPILKSFNCLHGSEVFRNIWQSKLKEVSENEQILTFTDIISKIWVPVYNNCSQLINDVKNMTIKLKDVDHHFFELREHIVHHLHALAFAIDSCSGSNPADDHWIMVPVRHMKLYWSLHQQADAASIVLKLKENFHLSGNFDVIYNLASSFSIPAKDSSLHSIDQTLQETVSFLQKLASDAKKLESLEKFLKCINIVEWMKDFGGVPGLQEFVNVALHTSAGEGAYSSDKLSNLKTVGTGYGPLIYDLPEDSSFEVFQHRCEAVWESMQQQQKYSLPDLLVECNQQLGWYQHAKESQASVEVTSFSQMKIIMNYGCFIVGSKESHIFKSLHEVIQVVLKESVAEEHSLGKESYDLEELRDLESKLVLITGSKEDNRAEVDTFIDIFHSICRIAELLLVMQQTGNVKYTSWRLFVPCSAESKMIDELNTEAKKMEEELDEWKRVVKHWREDFYELNYFTTLQALKIREELGRFRKSNASTVSPDILTLLQSISSQVSSSDVSDAVSSVAIKSVPGTQLLVSESSSTSAASVAPKSRVAETKEDFSEKRALIDSITRKLNCSEKVVENAIQDCPSGSSEDTLLQWCVRNMYKQVDVDEESDYSSDDSVSEYSDQESIEDAEVSNISGITKTEVSIVDENNPDVKSLVASNFPVEQSIRAISEYGTPEQAIEHLLAGELESQSHQDDLGNEWECGGPARIVANSNAEKDYLTLQELGVVLQILSARLPGEVQFQRKFHTSFIKEGQPNLLVVAPTLIIKSAIYFYMHNHDDNLSGPLPTPEEVLVCGSSTTVEQLEIFWRRAIFDPGNKRIFCLMHAEKLSYQVSDEALNALFKLSRGKKGYRLVIICSSEKEDTSHFISKLHNYRCPFVAAQIDSTEYKSYFINKLTSQVKTTTAARLADYENSRVRIVSSERSGMGKSLYIKRLGDKLLEKVDQRSCVVVTIPLHGPVVNSDTVLDLFQIHLNNPSTCIYHIDIAPSVLWQVDIILFSLLILGTLTDSQGRVWRCHPNQLYAVEVTLPARQNCAPELLPESSSLALLNILPSVQCQSPQNSKLRVDSDSLILMDSKEYGSDSYQRVYQYLSSQDDPSDFVSCGEQRGSQQDCLEVLLRFCGIEDPSWSEIRHFVKFLDVQLKSCENSPFMDPAYVGDVLAGMKKFVVKFMIQMSRDFSTPSMDARQVQGTKIIDDMSLYQVRRRWEESPHPYLFFNEDQHSITFVGFNVTKSGDLIDPSTNEVIEANIMDRDLYTGLIQNRVDFNDKYQNWTPNTMRQTISKVMGVNFSDENPDETYVLTVDNVIKILAIQMRFRCGIPVVIMGETGCGKTRLIRYMCDLARQDKDGNNMLILKIHGGTTENDIVQFICKAEEVAIQNKDLNLDTVAFFDEANTTDAIGLIKEIMCDRRINGKPVSDSLKFIAACNPYRQHGEKMIERLENAGLGFYVKSSETEQKLGKIPLRQLVYRVLDLPQSLRSLIYDFGQLNEKSENDYIEKIVSSHLDTHENFQQENLSQLVTNVLSFSQKYMRKTKDECSFVSLRDVERAMIVFKYMYQILHDFEPIMDAYAHKELNKDAESDDEATYNPPSRVARALILALSVCYHARLYERHPYERAVSKEFKGCIALPGGYHQFRNEIRWCQEALLNSMKIEDNIAKNAALRENVFMMAICVELRIPLFLVGKPGSSKSLAKSIINENFRGKTSPGLLQNFKEVQIFSYQCSQLSTSESIIEVFDTARQFQDNQDKSKFVSVVVLDEVGLAEDSPNLPLKALHPLLEDGTEGAKKDFANQIIQRDERVAFIGISNWALDPAKMNRGVMVTRNEPTEDELITSAQGICYNGKNSTIEVKLKGYFKNLARAYLAIYKRQDKEFFGLRDFYSMIKMLYYMCEKSDLYVLTGHQLEHAIRRNFGGLESSDWCPYDMFSDLIVINKEKSVVSKEFEPILYPDCSSLGLIRSCLNSQEQSFHGESRYVMFLTENYAALDILKNPTLSACLSTVEFDDGNVAHDVQPFILFGSSFPKDKEYTQVCRNINQIKICMETGRTVILLNLENLYESLYDVLNQYYIYYAGNKYVDLGLQTHRVRCRVHNSFKLILIAEKDTVYEKFPTPLINRLEKHFVLTSSILEEWQEQVLADFDLWITDFSSTDTSYNFTRADAFIGFQKDTPAAVIFQATTLLKDACSAARRNPDSIEDKWKTVLENSQLPVLKWGIQQESSPELWNSAVLNLSKFLLLQTSTPDAIVRLARTGLNNKIKDIEKIYFKKQCHDSISKLLLNYTQGNHGLLMQVTTHSYYLSQDDIASLEEEVGITVDSFFLHKFDTELDFCTKIGPTFKASGNTEKRLVIIQCDSGHLNGDLIACARYRIYDLRAKSDSEQLTHVLFIIHLPRLIGKTSSFVGFQGDPWISCHVDDLQSASNNADFKSSFSQLFIGASKLSAEHSESAYLDKSSDNYSSDEDEIPLSSLFDTVSESDESESENSSSHKSEMVARKKTLQHPLYFRLHGNIQAAVSRLTNMTPKRSTKLVEILVRLIPKMDEYEALDEGGFHEVLIKHIYNVLCERDRLRVDERDWLVDEASDVLKLRDGGTFRNVLFRKVDSVVIPIFSEVIALVDRNFNLNLIDPKHGKPHVSDFFLKVFREHDIVQFSYTDMITPRNQVPGIGSRMASRDFKSEFPFSWIIHQAMERHWNSVKCSAGDEKSGFWHQQFYDVINSTSVGMVIRAVEEDVMEDFYQRYLHDFVRLVHACNHKYQDDEYKLIASALDAVVNKDESHVLGEKVTLLHWIVTLHVVYERNKPQVMWFGHLTAHSPDLVKHVMNEDLDRAEVVLHLLAVRKLLRDIIPPLQEDPDYDLNQWLDGVHGLQSTITSIVSAKSQSVIRKEAWLIWEEVSLLQLFIEHVLQKVEFSKGSSYLLRLHILVKRKEFSKASTLHLIKQFLSKMYDDAKDEKLVDKEEFSQFKQCGQIFFFEVVSSLCFGNQDEAPESQLIEKLMNMIFRKSKHSGTIKTQEISPHKDTDAYPVIRSSLLQLLLEHNSDDVKSHLELYFKRSQETLEDVDQNLYLLCIQCLEDALYREHSNLHLDERLKLSIDLLMKSHQKLLKHSAAISIYYLEGIAEARFALTEISHLINSQCCGETNPFSELVASEALLITKKMCEDPNINNVDVSCESGIAGPLPYLIKLIIRQFGFPCLQQATTKYQWILPIVLRNSDQERAIDPFVVYNTDYIHIRNLMDESLYAQKMDLLESKTELHNKQESVLFLLAVYKSITLRYASTDPSLNDDFFRHFKTFLGTSGLSPPMKNAAKILLENKQGSNKLDEQMCISPELSSEKKIIGSVIVHTISVLLASSNNVLLTPFLYMLNSPDALIEAYLPTMAEDSVQEVFSALASSEDVEGKLYECPRGHRYFIGNCGNPWSEGHCITCGAKVGGTSHALLDDNKKSSTTDTTETGHILGDPMDKNFSVASERSLFPSSVCIMRALMHSAFLWCSIHSIHYQTNALIKLIKPSFNPKFIPEFFWSHLSRDIEQLSHILKKSLEEVAFIIHLVLHQIMNTSDTAISTDTDGTLKSKRAREQWEKEFDARYILPVLGNLENNIDNAMDLVAKDDRQKHGKLFYLAYEKSKVTDANLSPHLWSYRQRVSLEHIQQTLQEKHCAQDYPMLYEFLQKEPSLRATQYLPDIVQLQKFVFDKANHRFGRDEAEKLSIGDYMNSIKNEHDHLELQSNLNSLNKAWTLVRSVIKEHGRLLEDGHYLDTINEKTTLNYIIPTMSGAGAFTTCLVDYLIRTHNSFIKKFSNSKSLQLKHEVPVTHVHRNHLLDYENQIISVVLSHCCYSLRVGEAHTVEYDLQALEKHILNKFIHGKPVIFSDIPQVVYRDDVYNTVTFSQVRRKCAPQEAIQLHARKEILCELHTPDLLRGTLDVVDIVIGFLSTGGGQADMRFAEYVDRVLKMKKRPFSVKVREFCRLSHVMSLWKALSLELARLTLLQGQEPFEFDAMYKTELSRDTDVEALNACLEEVVDFYKLLGAFYEFIQTYIKYLTRNELQWTILEVIVEDQFEHLDFDPEFIERFPEDITQDKTIAVWKHIALYHQDKHSN